MPELRLGCGVDGKERLNYTGLSRARLSQKSRIFNAAAGRFSRNDRQADHLLDRYRIGMGDYTLKSFVAVCREKTHHSFAPYHIMIGQGTGSASNIIRFHWYHRHKSGLATTVQW